MEAAAGPGTEPHSNVFVRNLPGEPMSWQAVALIYMMAAQTGAANQRSLTELYLPALNLCKLGVPDQFHVFRSPRWPSTGSISAFGLKTAARSPRHYSSLCNQAHFQ